MVQHVRSQLELRGVQFANSSASAAAAAKTKKEKAAAAAAVAAPSLAKHASASGLGIYPFAATGKGAAAANPNYHPLPETKNVRAIMTVIRDKTTKQAELQFAVARLCRLLFSFGMELAPYEPITVITPTGQPFTGTTLKPSKQHETAAAAAAAAATPAGAGTAAAVVDAAKAAVANHTSHVCAVSIVRSGEALERTFCESFPDVAIGKIVITQNRGVKGDGPRVRIITCLNPSPRAVLALTLPLTVVWCDVCLRAVVLFQISGGDRALPSCTVNGCCIGHRKRCDYGYSRVIGSRREGRKYRVLLFERCTARNPHTRMCDLLPNAVHCCSDVTLLSRTCCAVCVQLHQFPKLHVCVASEEDGLNEDHYVVPGVGALGDRFFGTDSITSAAAAAASTHAATAVAAPAASPAATAVKH